MSFATLFVIFFKKKAKTLKPVGREGEGAVYKVYCYTAGSFFTTVRVLVGCFEVSWCLTMKLFLSGQHFKIFFVMGKSALLPTVVDRRLPLQWDLMNFQLYSLEKHWDSRKTKLTVSHGTGHRVFMMSNVRCFISSEPQLRIELTTLQVLVQRLYHWATGDSKFTINSLYTRGPFPEGPDN